MSLEKLYFAILCYFHCQQMNNAKRIEKVSGHKLSSDKTECITLYEDVPFRETFIGTPEVLVSTAVIGLVAGGSAVLVPIIQGIAKAGIKNLGKKIAKKTNQD